MSAWGRYLESGSLSVRDRRRGGSGISALRPLPPCPGIGAFCLGSNSSSPTGFQSRQGSAHCVTGGSWAWLDPVGVEWWAEEPGRSLSPCALACRPQLPAPGDCPFQRWRRTAPSPFSPSSFNKELRDTPRCALHTPAPTPTNWKISALAWLSGGPTGVWLLCGRPGILLASGSLSPILRS